MIPQEETSDGMFIIIKRELKNNSRYFFKVIAVNVFGGISSEAVQIGKCMCILH